MGKPFYIDWYAKDALDGMIHLSPWEELAYRRILDMIYASDNNLLDDDGSLRWSTKTDNKWPKIKKRLLDLGKIYVENGKIQNSKCIEKLQKSHARINQKSIAGDASAEARKLSKNNNTNSTGVGTGVATEKQRAYQQTTNYKLSEAKASDAEASEPAMKKMIFNEGLDYLSKATGKESKNLRPVLGKWCSKWGDSAVATALMEAEKFSAIEPISFIEKQLKAKDQNEGSQTFSW